MPFYYGWVIVVVAALAMVGTLPGRTQGLGLITESLLVDLSMSREAYAGMNFWGTVLGALFCLPVGRALDRFGTRRLLSVVAAALGLTVIAMSHANSAAALFGLLTLTRGLGQSALSVISIAVVGKWFGRRLSAAMGVFSVLMGVLFAVAFPVVGSAVVEHGWRAPWRAIGLALLFGLAPLGWLLARSDPASCGLSGDAAADADPTDEPPSATLSEALRTPCFWAFAGATSLFGLAASGIGLFNESIFHELGFGAEVYHRVVAGTFLVGLLSQMTTGWAGGKWSLRSLLTIALSIYGAALLWLPHIASQSMLWANAALLGGAGGVITVAFFAIWRQQYGLAHLGRIQGAAQMLTVFASALGPVIFSRAYAATGAYTPALQGLAAAVLLTAAYAGFVPLRIATK